MVTNARLKFGEAQIVVFRALSVMTDQRHIDLRLFHKPNLAVAEVAADGNGNQ